jgi:hypothetical protein
MNDDVIFEIYKFLPVGDLINCSLVSKQFYRVTQNDVLWKENVREVVKFDGSYLESYKFNYGLEKVGLTFKANIKDLYGFTFLNNAGIKIKTVPYQIGLLDNLQSLYLYNNLLKDIPTQLGNLKNLRVLSLSQNQLTTIPSELGNLSNLNTFWLHTNYLTSIPSELGKLQKLEFLYLYTNQLTSIPDELGNLQKLKKIDIRHNHIKHIPEKLYQIPGIKIEK